MVEDALHVLREREAARGGDGVAHRCADARVLVEEEREEAARRLGDAEVAEQRQHLEALVRREAPPDGAAGELGDRGRESSAVATPEHVGRGQSHRRVLVGEERHDPREELPARDRRQEPERERPERPRALRRELEDLRVELGVGRDVRRAQGEERGRRLERPPEADLPRELLRLEAPERVHGLATPFGVVRVEEARDPLDAARVAPDGERPRREEADALVQVGEQPAHLVREAREVVPGEELDRGGAHGGVGVLEPREHRRAVAERRLALEDAKDARADARPRRAEEPDEEPVRPLVVLARDELEEALLDEPRGAPERRIEPRERALVGARLPGERVLHLGPCERGEEPSVEEAELRAPEELAVERVEGDRRAPAVDLPQARAKIARDSHGRHEKREGSARLLLREGEGRRLDEVVRRVVLLEDPAPEGELEREGAHARVRREEELPRLRGVAEEGERLLLGLRASFLDDGPGQRVGVFERLDPEREETGEVGVGELPLLDEPLRERRVLGTGELAEDAPCARIAPRGRDDGLQELAALLRRDHFESTRARPGRRLLRLERLLEGRDELEGIERGEDLARLVGALALLEEGERRLGEALVLEERRRPEHGPELRLVEGLGLPL